VECTDLVDPLGVATTRHLEINTCLLLLRTYEAYLERPMASESFFAVGVNHFDALLPDKRLRSLSVQNYFCTCGGLASPSY
jgi:hypothetical protein